MLVLLSNLKQLFYVKCTYLSDNYFKIFKRYFIMYIHTIYSKLFFSYPSFSFRSIYSAKEVFKISKGYIISKEKKIWLKILNKQLQLKLSMFCASYLKISWFSDGIWKNLWFNIK